MQNLLGFIHGIDYALHFFLVGSIFFRYFILPVGGVPAKAIALGQQKEIQVLIGLSLITSTFWLLFTVHDMTETWAWGDLWLGMSQTSFSHICCLKILFLSMVLAFLRIRPQSNLTPIVLVVLSFVVLLSFVFTAHASSMADSTFLRMLIDFVHSASVSIWTGGLLSLFIWLRKRLEIKSSLDPSISLQVITRFSHFAMLSTALIGVTGVFIAWFNGVSLVRPWETSYGTLAFLKLILFCGALAAAAANQFLHLKQWNSEEEMRFSSRIYREVKIELLLLVIIFILAGFLSRAILPDI